MHLIGAQLLMMGSSRLSACFSLFFSREVPPFFLSRSAISNVQSASRG
jgi:hypothetical protein